MCWPIITILLIFTSYERSCSRIGSLEHFMSQRDSNRIIKLHISIKLIVVEKWILYYWRRQFLACLKSTVAPIQLFGGSRSTCFEITVNFPVFSLMQTRSAGPTNCLTCPAHSGELSMQKYFIKSIIINK